MKFSGYELLWLFFVYSLLGWILETVVAAAKQKRFVNKGLINLPFCILYGVVGVFLTVFSAELDGIWLYLGAVIIISVFKWLAGRTIEKFYHERWWDYSNRRFNLDGYVALTDSAVLGVLAYVMIKWGNGFAVGILAMLPELLRVIFVWILVGLIAVDALATLILSYGAGHKSHRWKQIDRLFDALTASFGRRIYDLIDRRIHRAYPHSQKVESEETAGASFAAGCGFHKLVWLFMIGSLLGDIVETIYCRITAGVWMSRSSVVWGPFSIVWGLAISIATVLLHRYIDKPERKLFFIGTVLGGAYEYVCSVFTELVFGKIFWDYSALPFNLGGRINLLYCFFWGIAAVVWIKGIYPILSGWIEKIPAVAGKILSWIFVVFMCCNMAVSGLALMRSDQRANGIPAEKNWQKIMDERFDNARMERIYPNAKTAE